MNNHKVVSREEGLSARKEHLMREKELTQLRDQLSNDWREFPWVRVEKAYTFDSSDELRLNNVWGPS